MSEETDAPAPEAWRATDIAALVREHNALLEESYKWKRQTNDRRERIATAALQGLLTDEGLGTYENYANDAVEYADALIAALDRKP